MRGWGRVRPAIGLELPAAGDERRAVADLIAIGYPDETTAALAADEARPLLAAGDAGRDGPGAGLTHAVDGR